MSTVWFNPCDSPACLIGHTLDLFVDDKAIKRAHEIFGGQASLACAALDIHDREADKLFYPANMNKLSVQDALDTLDVLLVTGHVEWPTKDLGI